MCRLNGVQFLNTNYFVYICFFSPATVILIIVGGLDYGIDINYITSLVLLLIVTFFYGLICLFTSQDFQLKTAKVLTLIFALLMGAVFVGLMEQIVQDVTSKGKSITLEVAFFYLSFYLTGTNEIWRDDFVKNCFKPVTPPHTNSESETDRRWVLRCSVYSRSYGTN